MHKDTLCRLLFGVAFYLCGSVVIYLLGVVFAHVSDVLHVVDADGAVDC